MTAYTTIVARIEARVALNGCSEKDATRQMRVAVDTLVSGVGLTGETPIQVEDLSTTVTAISEKEADLDHDELANGMTREGQPGHARQAAGLKTKQQRGRRRLVTAAPGWSRQCDWCGRFCAVATDGRNLVCCWCRH